MIRGKLLRYGFELPKTGHLVSIDFKLVSTDGLFEVLCRSAIGEKRSNSRRKSTFNRHSLRHNLKRSSPDRLGRVQKCNNAETSI